MTYRLPVRRIPAALAIFSAIVACATAAPAAAPSPQDVVAARHANFKKMGSAMKAIKDQLKSGAPSKEAVVAAAQTIATTARGQGALFPAGTGPAAGLKTEALPNIWTERAAFDAQMNKLVAESGKLLAAANSGDAGAISAQFEATGGTCGACHRQFRSDD